MPKNQSVSEERISQKLSSDTSSTKSKGKVIGIMGAILLIAIIVVLIVVFVKPNTTEAGNRVVTPDNVDEILADLQDSQKTSPGNYEVIMNSKWEFENGSSASSNAYVENATSNQNDVYFDVMRSDNNETIYKSPTIPVGSHLEGITLNKKLNKGTYPCVLTYHLLDKSGKPISKLHINLTISIKN